MPGCFKFTGAETADEPAQVKQEQQLDIPVRKPEGPLLEKIDQEIGQVQQDKIQSSDLKGRFEAEFIHSRLNPILMVYIDIVFFWTNSFFDFQFVQKSVRLIRDLLYIGK